MDLGIKQSWWLIDFETKKLPGCICQTKVVINGPGSLDSPDFVKKILDSIEQPYDVIWGIKLVEVVC